MLKKPEGTTGTKTAQSIDDYIQSRIDNAVSNGFNSTKIWVKNDNYDAAVRLLNQSQFAFEILVTEPKSKQLSVSW